MSGLCWAVLRDLSIQWVGIGGAPRRNEVYLRVSRILFTNLQLLDDGLSMYLVSRCLGHSDINTTLAQYAHVQNASLSGVMNHIGQSANQPEAAKTGQLSSKDPA
jgi:hypothetical protein